ncbi:MAG: response regulator [Deltaproteobacteria bacterium]|nr:response regulator [Deltaproteobacteria bacterium]
MASEKKILFADDEEPIRALYGGVLRAAGYSVDAAISGMDAFFKIKRTGYDLIIADIKMPELDGIGLYLTSIKFFPALSGKFLFLIQDDCEEKETRTVLERMGLKFLVKPFEIYELLEMVKEFTGESQPVVLNFEPQKVNHRLERRFCWEEDCRIIEKDSHIPRPFTSTTDISKNGARIRYIGKPIKPDSAVRIDIKYLEVRSRARIVWSKAINDMEAMSGLKLFDPIPASAMVTILQGSRWHIPPLISTKKAVK